MKTSKTTSWMDKWFQDSEQKRLILQEEFVLRVSEKILSAMDDDQVNKSDLAARLGKSRAYISQLLDGSRNMTLRTLSDICFAVNMVPEISLMHEETEEPSEGFISAEASAWQRDPEYMNIRDIWAISSDEKKRARKKEQDDVSSSEIAEGMGVVAA